MIHTHKCYLCEAELTCCCPDRRDVDRVTGKERRILCLDCEQMQKELKAFFYKEART